MRNTSKGLTKQNIKHMLCQMNNIAKLEGVVSDKELRQMLYVLGVYAYRQHHKAGIPVDMKQPRLTAPKKVWSSILHEHVDERIKDVLEENYIREEEQVALAA